MQISMKKTSFAAPYRSSVKLSSLGILLFITSLYDKVALIFFSEKFFFVHPKHSAFKISTYLFSDQNGHQNSQFDKMRLQIHLKITLIHSLKYGLMHILAFTVRQDVLNISRTV